MARQHVWSPLEQVLMLLWLLALGSESLWHSSKSIAPQTASCPVPFPQGSAREPNRVCLKLECFECGHEKQGSGLNINICKMQKSSISTEIAQICKSLLAKLCLAFKSYWESQEASPEPTSLP